MQSTDVLSTDVLRVLSGYMAIADIWRWRTVSKEWHKILSAQLCKAFKRDFLRRLEEMDIPVELLGLFRLPLLIQPIFSGSLPLSVLLGRRDWEGQDIDYYVDSVDVDDVDAFLQSIGPEARWDGKPFLWRVRERNVGYRHPGWCIYRNDAEGTKLMDICVIAELQPYRVINMADIEATGVCFDGKKLMVPRPGDVFAYRTVYRCHNNGEGEWPRHRPSKPPFFNRIAKYQKRGFTFT
jgi:hypothetical protein